jgi:hypothetical protein
VSAAGVASLSIACKGSVACRGAAELFANAPAGTAKALAKVRIGSTRFTIPARKTKVVKITLSKRGKQLLRKTRRLRVQLVLTLASSNGPRKISRNLTLVAGNRRN